MEISLIIPTLNAGASIGHLLSRLFSQDIGFSEIIIIDSSSEDDTVKIARGFGIRTIVIPRHTFNHGKTRNTAALEAKGDVLLFMTQDAMPADNTLVRKLTVPLERPDVAATYGRQIPRSGASPVEAFARYFNYPDESSCKGSEDLEKHGIKTIFFSNVCSSIKKELFMKVGMFHEGIRTNEDMLIAAEFIAHGYKIAYVPEARVVHSHNYSLPDQFRRYYNIGWSIKKNRWIFEYLKAEGEGTKFMKEQIKFLVKQHKYAWLPYMFLESATKYAGFKIGLIAG
jgi:rhamnosyltransferase